MKTILAASLLCLSISARAATPVETPIVEYKDCEFPPSCEVLRVFMDGRVSFYNPVDWGAKTPPKSSLRGDLIILADSMKDPLIERALAIKSRKLLNVPSQDRRNGMPWHQELTVFPKDGAKPFVVVRIGQDGKYLSVEDWQASRIFGLMSDLMHTARTQAVFPRRSDGK